MSQKTYTRFYEEKDGVVNQGSTVSSSPSPQKMDRRLRTFGAPFSPLMGFGRSFFDDADFASMHRPYWADTTMLGGHRIGDGVADIIDNETEFKFTIDVSQFEPEELKVNIVDNDIVIEAQHNEKSDKFGTVSRQFTRKFRLPPSVKPEEVKSELSKEGHLTIRFEKQPPSTNIKTIPISIKKN